jgi:hypothetical protein
MLIKKSQITMEFMLLIGFVLVISLSFLAVAGELFQNFRESEKKSLIDDFGSSIKKELDLASVVKEGYKRTITLPEKIDGSINYSIENKNVTLIIRSDDDEFSWVIPNTVGTLKKGENVISKVNNSVSIKNA